MGGSYGHTEPMGDEDRPFADIRRTIHDVLRLLSLHRWAFFVPFSVVACAVFILSLYYPRTYRASSSFERRNDPVMMNLASNEYFKSVKPRQLDARIVTPNFKEARHGTYKSIGTFAKKARGLMASYIIHNQLTDVEDVKSFDAEGYRFDAKLSSDDDWIFTRESA